MTQDWDRSFEKIVQDGHVEIATLLDHLAARVEDAEIRLARAERENRRLGTLVDMLREHDEARTRGRRIREELAIPTGGSSTNPRIAPAFAGTISIFAPMVPPAEPID